MLIDLSSNNHPAGSAPFDYAAAKAGGVQAVFVKATDGTGYVNPFYAQDVAGFLGVGVPVLAYHFAEFGDPKAEAAHFLSVAGARARVLDSETNTDAAWQDEFLAALNLPASEELDYGSGSTLPRGVRALLWPAAYGKDPGFGDVWQYTDVAQVPGIPGNVDASVWKGSVADFYGLFTLNPGPNPQPKPDPGPPPPTEATVNTLDPTTDGTWIVDPTDGHVEAIHGAPYLGGLIGNRFGWQQVGTIAGIQAVKDPSGTWGYDIIVRAFQVEPAGNWFTVYHFPRDGSLVESHLGVGEYEPTDKAATERQPPPPVEG